MYPSGGFSFSKVKCVKPVHESDKSLGHINVPIIVDAAFLYYIQGNFSSPGDVNAIQWNRTCFFSRL